MVQSSTAEAVLQNGIGGYQAPTRLPGPSKRPALLHPLLQQLPWGRWLTNMSYMGAEGPTEMATPAATAVAATSPGNSTDQALETCSHLRVDGMLLTVTNPGKSFSSLQKGFRRCGMAFPRPVLANISVRRCSQSCNGSHCHG